MHPCLEAAEDPGFGNIDWNAGIELISPIPGAGEPAAAFTTFLESQGEGLYSVVMAVPAVDTPTAIASRYGADVEYEQRRDHGSLHQSPLPDRLAEDPMASPGLMRYSVHLTEVADEGDPVAIEIDDGGQLHTLVHRFDRTSGQSPSQ